jgi:hypothetical protein
MSVMHMLTLPFQYLIIDTERPCLQVGRYIFLAPFFLLDEHNDSLCSY